MFLKKSTPTDSDAVVETTDPETPTSQHIGKGHPTPKRKEREALNKRPLVGGNRKESRQRELAERERARAGMMAGDERYLPARDKGPQKRWVRQYVDARWNVGELMLPVAGFVFVSTLVPAIVAYSSMLMWVYFIILIIDSFILRALILRRAKAVFGEDELEKGLGWYGIMRALQLRPLRMPKPQTSRGDYPPLEK